MIKKNSYKLAIVSIIFVSLVLASLNTPSNAFKSVDNNKFVSTSVLENWVPTPSNGKKILFDEHHMLSWGFFSAGSVSMMGGYLLQAGYSLDDDLNTELTESYLSNYDIVVISFPKENFTTSEISAVQNYIQGGGSVIFEGISSGTPVRADTTKLNPITTPLGVTYEKGLVDLRATVTNFTDSHPVTNGVTGVYITNIAPMDITPGLGIQVLSYATPTNPLIAVREYGAGKIVFLPTPYIFVDLINSGHQNILKLIINIFDWTSGATSTIETSYTPINMPIPIRESEQTPDGILRRYQLYYGVTHVHSTEGSSDSSEPVANQIDTSRALGYDFMTLTDHDSDYPENSWAPATNYIASKNITDLNLILGIEADPGLHVLTFPIQHQYQTKDPYDMVQEYHKQGAVMFMAHPTLVWGDLAENYIENFDAIGFDGFEIVNSGYFTYEEGGAGEFALNHPFVGSSDAHSSSALNRASNIVFVKNLTTAGLIDGILNRRNVVYSYRETGDLTQFYTGDTDWLNEFARRNISVTNGVAGFKTYLNTLSGQDTSVAMAYLNNATNFLNLRNVRRANENLINSINSIYSVNVDLSSINNLQVGDSFKVNFNVKENSGNTISGSKLQLILYDNQGANVYSQQVSLTTDGQTINIPISLSSSPGEYYVWYNVSVGTGFYENGQLLTVNQGQTSSSSSTSKSTTSTGSAYGFSLPFVLISITITSVYLIHKKRKY